MKKNYRNIIISFCVILLSFILTGYLTYEKNKEIKLNYKFYVSQSKEKISLNDVTFNHYMSPSEKLVYKDKRGNYIYNDNLDMMVQIKDEKYAFSQMDCMYVMRENQRLGIPSYFYKSKDESFAILLLSKFENIYFQGSETNNYCILNRMY